MIQEGTIFLVIFSLQMRHFFLGLQTPKLYLMYSASFDKSKLWVHV